MLFQPTPAGALPPISRWDISPFNLEQDLTAHIAALPRNAAGNIKLSSNAIMLRLPDHVRVEAVRDAVLQVVKQLIPLLDCDPQLDVQVSQKQ